MNNVPPQLVAALSRINQYALLGRGNYFSFGTWFATGYSRITVSANVSRETRDIFETRDAHFFFVFYARTCIIYIQRAAISPKTNTFDFRSKGISRPLLTLPAFVPDRFMCSILTSAIIYENDDKYRLMSFRYVR